MRDQTTTAPGGAIDVMRQRCPTARVSTVLPLALIEERDRARTLCRARPTSRR